jgi:hypothetical protein
MNIRFLLHPLAAGLLIAGCRGSGGPDSKTLAEFPEEVRFTALNPIAVGRIDEPVAVSVGDIRTKAPRFNPGAFLVLAGGKELASQTEDTDGDGASDRIRFTADFGPKQEQRFVIRYAAEGVKTRPYPSRTQAELSCKSGGRFLKRKYIGGAFRNVRSLRVPPEHTDHSFFIRYEGPGWESDRAAYRFYLDWRNAVDFFGKKTTDMVLQNVGQDGFESYHSMCVWGMDVLKVGESLGIGTIAMWLDGQAERVSKTDSVFCEIASNGPVESRIRTHYSGWRAGSSKYDLVSDLSISAGTRMTRHDVRISPDPPNLCTGVVKMDSATLLAPPGKTRGWTYLATWGRQSLNNDSLGLAVLFRAEDLTDRTEDKFSHVAVLKPEHGVLTYYLLAAWEKEPGGIRSRQAFVHSLDEAVSRLDAPVEVRP